MINETTLHGQVVGLGVQHKDGSKDFKWLDKPIHNRIVSGGIDNYFMKDGNPSTITSSSPEESANRFLTDNAYGNKNAVIEYIAIGTDGTPTEFTDTGLRSQVGGFSNTLPYNSVPYFGTRLNSDLSTSFRLPRQSVTVSEATSVREIGWFGKYSSSDTYVMFSRVVLPAPVELAIGDSLLVIYQMNISYGAEETEVSSSLLSGLLDSDGNPLRGRSSYRLYFYLKPTIDTWYATTPSGARVSAAYAGTFIGVGNYLYGAYDTRPMGSGIGLQYGAFRGSAPFDTYRNPLSYTVNASWEMKEQGEALSSNNYLTDSGNLISNIPKPYVPGTYYRDREIEVAPVWPSMSNPGDYQDIYAICHNCVLIRFGYMDTTDPDSPVWVPKPWRKKYGERFVFTFRTQLSTADTI